MFQTRQLSCSNLLKMCLTFKHKCDTWYMILGSVILTLFSIIKHKFISIQKCFALYWDILIFVSFCFICFSMDTQTAKTMFNLYHKFMKKGQNNWPENKTLHNIIWSPELEVKMLIYFSDDSFCLYTLYPCGSLGVHKLHPNYITGCTFWVNTNCENESSKIIPHRN